MASSTETMHEEETAPLVGAVPAPGEWHQPTVVVPPRPQNNPNQVNEAAAAASTEVRISAVRAAIAEAEKKIHRPRPDASTFPRSPRGRRRLAYLLFPDPPIRVGQPLNAQQLQMLSEERFRSMMPGYFERLAMDRHLVTECLHHYNSKNTGNEYEPAPWKVTQHFRIDNGICWAHGNFLARWKPSGCFSFLPGPRTLFFFELAYIDGFDGVVTCIPLDEPVTEAYSVLFGGLLAVVADWIPFARHTIVALMFHILAYRRYLTADVLHPYPEDFEFGH